MFPLTLGNVPPNFGEIGFVWCSPVLVQDFTLDGVGWVWKKESSYAFGKCELQLVFSFVLSSLEGGTCDRDRLGREPVRCLWVGGSGSGGFFLIFICCIRGKLSPIFCCPVWRLARVSGYIYIYFGVLFIL